MRFEEAYTDWHDRRLTQAEAARLLGVFERTLRRQIDRYEADGLDGLIATNGLSKSRTGARRLRPFLLIPKRGFHAAVLVAQAAAIARALPIPQVRSDTDGGQTRLRRSSRTACSYQLSPTVRARRVDAPGEEHLQTRLFECPSLANTSLTLGHSHDHKFGRPVRNPPPSAPHDSKLRLYDAG